MIIDLGDDATIEKIGPPEKVINAFGPEVIGENVEGKVLSMNVEEHSGRTYYRYELEPPHALVTATAAGNRLYLFSVTGSGMEFYPTFHNSKNAELQHCWRNCTHHNDFVGLQWKRHYEDLKKIADSFRVI